MREAHLFPTKKMRMILRTTCSTSPQKDEVIPKESFSPESGGRVKARMAIEAMRMQGIIRLKKLRIYIYI